MATPLNNDIDFTLARIRDWMRKGEYFRVIDEAREAFKVYPADALLQHQCLLAMANSGATRQALSQFEAWGLGSSTLADIQTLRARLFKDLGFATEPAEARQWFAQSSMAYEACYRQNLHSGTAYYPAINAASTALFAGQPERADHWGHLTLRLLDDAPNDYWSVATRLEALLLTGNVKDAQRALPQVMALAAGDRTALASTMRQIRRIQQCLGLTGVSLNWGGLGSVLHYTGHLVSANGRLPAHELPRVQTEVAALVQRLQVQVAYGALAAGADIVFAEALLQQGADLHVVLPFAVDEFVRVSVLPCGADWVSRFEVCLNAASSVRLATDDQYLGDDNLFAYSSQLAMGLALLTARHLGVEPAQAAVWDGQNHGGVAGTVVDIQHWKATGHNTHVISSVATSGKQPTRLANQAAATVRQPKSMLFADVKGFSALNDAQMPAFSGIYMEQLARVLQQHTSALDYVNTWGDGIFAVFSNPVQAAQCALNMQAAVSTLELAEHGLPPTLALRIGVHHGPVYWLKDPITQRYNAMGAHVNRAARIEPVTPVGSVYVTETLAAVLALSAAHPLVCDYVGQMEAAKSFGVMRMFSVRAAHAGAAPAVLLNFDQPATTPQAQA